METIPEWVNLLRSSVGASDPDGIGTIRHIDKRALRRGVGSISQAQAFALGRVPDRGEGWDVDLHQHQHGAFMGVADDLKVACHGTGFTHIDGLNHVGADDWYEVPDGDQPTALSRWADARIVTRGVLVDIPSIRGVDWVEIDDPVTGAEIDEALDRSSIEFDSGDALLVYMGRDRFEAAGHTYTGTAAAVNGRPGIGTSAAQWVADNKVAALGWDFMDARNSDGEHAFVGHMLIWAIGLALIDNCHLGDAARNARETGQSAGLLSVAFPAFDSVSGLPVNPMLVF